MANTSSPGGFRPKRYLSGQPYNGAVNHFFTNASDGTAVYLGDPVTLRGSSQTVNGETYADVTIGTAGSGATLPVVGAMVAVFPDVATSTVYRVASTQRKVAVATDPWLVYEIEEGITGAGAGTALAIGDIGLNANYVITAGSTVTGWTGTVLDNSTEATTTTLDCRIVGFVNRADNEAGVRAKWLVRFNNHHHNSLVAIT